MISRSASGDPFRCCLNPENRVPPRLDAPELTLGTAAYPNSRSARRPSIGSIVIPWVVHRWRIVSHILGNFSRDDHVLRPRAPRLQLLLYGDYSCSLTAKHDTAIRGALGEIPEDVAYIYRHYPQSAAGRRAAECAVAAACQDRFWSLHAWLFTHQLQLDDASLVEHAVSLHLDVGRFLKDLAGSVPREK